MTGFVVTVDFTLKPGGMAAFRKLIDENAHMSCLSEPGCRRFDVLAPRESGDRIFLYEIYDDRAAFDAHVQSPHFAAFNEACAELVTAKRVAEFDLVVEGSNILQGRGV